MMFIEVDDLTIRRLRNGDTSLEVFLTWAEGILKDGEDALIKMGMHPDVQFEKSSQAIIDMAERYDGREEDNES